MRNHAENTTVISSRIANPSAVSYRFGHVVERRGDDVLYQVARVTVEQLVIAPGQRAPFEIRPMGRGLKEITKYELFVEGRPTP